MDCYKLMSMADFFQFSKEFIFKLYMFHKNWAKSNTPFPYARGLRLYSEPVTIINYIPYSLYHTIQFICRRFSYIVKIKKKKTTKLPKHSIILSST